MAIFDYKNYGTEKSKELFSDVYDLVAYTQYLVDTPQPGWKLITANELQYKGNVDDRGTYYGEFFYVGTAQAEVLGKYDDQGNLTSVGISFRGTGGPPEQGIKDFLRDFVNDIHAAVDPNVFGTYYPYLAFGNLLSKVADYARQHGLSGEDITITGASLGGLTVNSMADLSEKLWGGFYKDSNYIAAVSPTQSATGKVLNVGAENDPVFRMMENGKLTPGSLSYHDLPGATTTDNIINFDNHYVDLWQNLLPHSVVNPQSWQVHDSKEIASYMHQILNMELYELTSQDSRIIVSNLTGDKRDTTWVEDLGLIGYTHSGPQFILGTDSDDLIRGDAGTSYLEGGLGDDKFQDQGGYNIILGGQGYDTLELKQSLKSFTFANDGAGTLYVRDAKGGISITRDIDAITSKEPFIFGLKVDVTRSVTDKTVKYAASEKGDAAANTLTAQTSGEWLFGLEGDDTLTGGAGNDVLVGGAGNDQLNAGEGSNTFLFHGNFGQDRIYGFNASDNLKFVGVSGVTDNTDYHSFATKGEDGSTVLTFGGDSVTLVGVNMESLSSTNIVIA